MKIHVLVALISTLSLIQLRAADNLSHPILTISGSGSGANTVTNIAESAYTNNFIPHTPPRNDDDGFAPAVVAGDTGWSWSSSAPNQLKSTPSGTIFPNTNTAQYPVRTQAVNVFLTTATNNDIQTVNAVYYNRAGSTTAKSMVFNVIDMHKRDQLRGDFNKLAPAYLLSGSSPNARNDNYARRIGVSLLDWARWYPKYYLSPINSAGYIDVTTNYSASTGGFGPQRASDHNGLAHEWDDDELKAFDAVYSSGALTNLSAEMGFDVRQYICDNLFFNEGDFLVNHIPVDIAIQSNLSGPYAVLPEVARVLDRPDYILWMDSYLDATVRKKIRRDGTLEEGEGYSIGYLNSNQDAAQNTSDYFLTRAATNSVLFAISNRAKIYNTSLKYGQAQWATIALPNGQLPSFGDTPFNTYFSARNKGNSAVLPAYGALSLGAGTSSTTAVQVNQSFPGNNNHMRADMAAFSLWAFGNEYLGNIRYYNGAVGRDFGEQILEKNDVTIDRGNLSPYPDADTYGNGNLDIYEDGVNGLAMTEIDGYRAYSSKASRFQRLLLLNTVDLNKPYVVDVFRVTGGTTHDYTFHGSVRWTQTGQCSFPLVTNNNLYPMLEGSETWSLATDTPFYGFFRGMNSNAVPGTFFLTYTDTNRTTARDTRLWMTADPGQYNVYLGWSPVPDRDDNVPTNFFNSQGLTRPSAIIRHRVSSGPLQDLFVSVVEPFKTGVSNIVSVERLAMSNNLESCGLKITFKDGRVDTYVVNLRNPKVAGAAGGTAIVGTTDGQYSLNGRVALHVDQPTGSDSRVWTVNATDFKYPGRELVTPADTYYAGWIAGETRKLTGGAYDAFTTATPLPTGTALRGAFLNFTHGNLSSGTTNISEMFKIDQIVLTNGLYHICFTNDHLLEITNGVTSREQVAPLRTFTTSNAFEIVMTAFAGQISPIADQTVASGNASAPLNFSFGTVGTTPGSAVQVRATSSNQALVPDSNLTLTTGGTNGTLTVATADGQTGSAVITVSTTDGAWTNSETFDVVVPDFTVAASPPAQTNTVGNSVSYTINTGSIDGFNDPVSFAVSGLPNGANATFNPATVNGAGSTTLTVTSSGSTPAGAYPLTITATSGNLTRTSGVTFSVTDFTVAASPLSQTVAVGGTATYTASATALNGFADTIAWTVSGLPSGTTAAFSPASVDGSGDSVLSLSTSGTTPAGTYALTVTGSDGALVHSANITLVVSDFSIAATPASQTVIVGNNTSYTVNLGSINGFNSAVALAITGLPAGATATFNPASVTPNGSATLTVTTSAATPAGTNTLTITGTSGGLAHSTTVTLAVVPPPDFTVSAAPSSQTVSAGSATTFSATLAALNGFNGTSTLSVSGLPANVAANFSPASVTGSGSSTLTIATTTSTPVGTNVLTITATSGSLVHTVTVTLAVTAAPDFTLTATPASRTVVAGSNTTYTATVSPLNSFSGTVALGISGLPAGATAAFSPASIAGSGSSTLTITTTGAAIPGTNTLTITGTSGSLVHSTTVTFIVNAAASGALPAGWTNVNIGAVGIAGSASYNAGTFTTRGSGSDIWTAGDQFNYTYQSANGDETIVARVVSENGANSFAKAGIMIRETLATNSIEVSVLLTPTNGVALEVRPATGATTINVTGWIRAATPPQWLKLVRAGNTFTASYSTNGIAWTPLAGTNVTMAIGATAGLAVTAHDNASLNTATFDNVSVTGADLTGTIYELQNLASSLVLNNQGFLTNGSAITQWTFKTNVNLEWTFIATSNGYYQINSSKSGLDAVVLGGSTAAGAGIVQWSFGSTGNDQWRPVQNSDGSYTFFNLKSGLVLGDPGSSTSTSTQMDQETSNGGSNQKWKLIKP